MIAVEEALASILLNDQAIGALVGDRVEPNGNSQGSSFPHLWYQRISTPRIRHLLGRSRLAYPRFQVNCCALSYADAKALAKAVVDCLEDTSKWRESFGPGWFIQGMYVEDERDHFSDDQHDADIGVHQVSVDVIIWHNEA